MPRDENANVRATPPPPLKDLVVRPPTGSSERRSPASPVRFHLDLDHEAISVEPSVSGSASVICGSSLKSGDYSPVPVSPFSRRSGGPASSHGQHDEENSPESYNGSAQQSFMRRLFASFRSIRGRRRPRLDDAGRRNKSASERSTLRLRLSRSFTRMRSSFRNLSLRTLTSNGSLYGGPENASVASSKALRGKIESEVPPAFLRQESIVWRLAPGQTFSEYASLKIDAGTRYTDEHLATLGELRHVLCTCGLKQQKQFIRENAWGVHHRIRVELWKDLCFSIPATDFDAQVLLFRTTNAALEGNVCAEALDLVSGPEVVVNHYSLNERGVAVLLRTLACLERLRPDLTCVPLLYSLSALFLHYYNEETAFACVYKLLVSEQKYFIRTEISLAAAKRTLLVLIKEHIPAVYSLFGQTLEDKSDKSELIALIDDWLVWLFDRLPLAHAVRMLDCFLFEGQKVLFRVCLACLALWHAERKEKFRKLTKQRKLMVSDIVDDIGQYCRLCPASPSQLLKVAFGIRNLRWSHIRSIQQRYEMLLRVKTRSLVSLDKAKKLPTISSRLQLHEFKLESDILTESQAQNLFSWIPMRYQLSPPLKVFCLAEDGNSFTTFWHHLEGHAPSIFVIQTSQNEVFGAFCSSSWSQRYHNSAVSYFGTGESFLFKCDQPGAGLTKYDWVGLRLGGDQISHNLELFQAADATSFTIGGGNGAAIRIQDSLDSGMTNHCDTFANPPLATGGHFCIQNFEVFSWPADEDDN